MRAWYFGVRPGPPVEVREIGEATAKDPRFRPPTVPERFAAAAKEYLAALDKVILHAEHHLDMHRMHREAVTAMINLHAPTEGDSHGNQHEGPGAPGWTGLSRGR